MRLLTLLLIALTLALPPIAHAEVAETRVALVIGNSRYEHETTLPNPENDAREVARALRRVGYDVTVEYDLTREQMTNALSAFGARAAEADVALAYYAGHGVQAGGENYLIPVDAELLHSYEFELKTVTLSALVNTTGQARNLSIVVLDACRNNRFRSRMIGRGRGDEIGRGLGRPPPRPWGSIIVYAAQEGEVAIDGVDGAKHSPFTAAFLYTLAEDPERDIGLFFRRVGSRVYRATNYAQRPARYDDLGGEEIPIGRPLTPAEIVQREHQCQTDTGTQGVTFAQKCWPLDTTKIEYGDIPLSVRRQITDAAPLAALTALQELSLWNTQVRDVGPLAALTALQRLDLSFTEVSDAAPLAALTALQRLYLGNTQVSDAAPLAALTALQTLDLSGTQVSDAAPLAALTALQWLSLSGTQVSDVAPLAALTALQELSLTNTQVSDAAPLAALTALQELSLWNTQVRDVGPLAALTALQELSLWNTQVRDVGPLAALTALQRLDLSFTEVSDAAPLAALTALQRLYLGNTQVSDVTPLSGLTGLHYLQMRDGVGVGGVSDTPANRAAVAQAIRTWRR